MLRVFNMMLFVAGIILITIGYTYNIKAECIPKIEYRYITKNTYDDLLYGNDMVEDVWHDMTNDDYMHNLNFNLGKDFKKDLDHKNAWETSYALYHKNKSSHSTASKSTSTHSTTTKPKPT